MPDAGFLQTPEQEKVQPDAVTPPAPEAAVEIGATPSVSEDISSVTADEEAMKQSAEIADEFLENAPEAGVPLGEGASRAEQTEAGGGATTASATASQTANPPVPVKDEITREIEEILGEGLGDYFKAMPEGVRVRFRAKGEEAAAQIAYMVRTMHMQVKKVLELIRHWLLTIPGINKFFLEQEAKIKTDRILELERERREPPAS